MGNVWQIQSCPSDGVGHSCSPSSWEAEDEELLLTSNFSRLLSSGPAWGMRPNNNKNQFFTSGFKMCQYSKQ